MTYFPFGHIIKPLPTYDHSHQAWNGLGGVRMGRLGCSCIEIMAARLPKTSRVVSVCVCVCRNPAAGHSSPKKLKVGSSRPISSRFQARSMCGPVVLLPKRKLEALHLPVGNQGFFGILAGGIPVLKSVSRPQLASEVSAGAS